MKKELKLMIGVIAIVVLVIAAAVVIVLNMNKEEGKEVANTPKSNLSIQSVEDLQNLVTSLYTGLEEVLPRSLATIEIDINNVDQFKSFTGLSTSEGVEYAVASEPMMSSQAYSLVLMKIKDGVDANQIAKTMSESIDTRKWICVSAEKLYATNSGNIVCLVMSSEEWAKPVYENFKSTAGAIGQEYEKTEAI